ncbi:hypothetical protein G7Y89_g1637 [Cudoniella acicularis]|uniref:Uncharacterized protein n=1 Tax=Cudoniella acicularis TaxID=354080 RepID=A0A8H4RUV2_9HELO|nr:hypothetical protein G7Y89_g1637 [Cudoniella acicularis]
MDYRTLSSSAIPKPGSQVPQSSNQSAVYPTYHNSSQHQGTGSGTQVSTAASLSSILNKPTMTQIAQQNNTMIVVGSLNKRKPAQPPAGNPKGAFITPYAQQMASQHSRFGTLPPDTQVLQEAWVGMFLKSLGICIGGFRWTREGKGYKCATLCHFVTDDLIIECRGGYLVRESGYLVDTLEPNTQDIWSGPYYPATAISIYSAADIKKVMRMPLESRESVAREILEKQRRELVEALKNDKQRVIKEKTRQILLESWQLGQMY